MKTIKERILEFIDYKVISNREFCKKIKVSPNTFSTKSALGSDILIKINNEHPELNMDWVVTGRGNMLYVPTRKERIPETQEEKEEWLRSFKYQVENIQDEEMLGEATKDDRFDTFSGSNPRYIHKDDEEGWKRFYEEQEKRTREIVQEELKKKDKRKSDDVAAAGD